MSWDIFSKSKIQYFLQKLKGIFDKKVETSNLAEPNATETTTTATKAHAKDSKFYLAATQQYCMASTNIAIGDTLVENTNYVEITINGFLTDMEYYLKMAGQVLETKVDKETGKGLSHNDFVANNTVLSTDKTPYLNRQCLTPTGFSSYVREKLIGCSVAWNQLVQNGDFASSSEWYSVGGTLSVSSNIATYTASNTINPGNARIYQSCTSIANHVYIYNAKIKVSRATQLLFYFGTGSSAYYDISANVWTKITLFGKPTASSSTFEIYTDTNGSLQGGDTVQFAEIQIIDLTLAFGSSVADTLYAMTNNGGIDWLRNHNYPIDQYTQYGYGLYSSKPSAKKVVGFNVWDGSYIDNIAINGGSGATVSNNSWFSSDYVPILPNTSYYFKVIMKNSSVYGYAFYDKNQQYISGSNYATDTGILGIVTSPSNAYYVRFSLYKTYDNSAVCINISDTNKNGTYEPYSCTTYSLGSTELRGHLIVQNGEIVAEGDVRESNGVVTRKYGIVDLGSLTWTYHTSGNMYTDNVVSDRATGSQTKVIAICERYVQCIGEISGVAGLTTDKAFAFQDTMIGRIIIRDTAYTNATSFKTAMSGVYLVYELATPTTEQSTPFADPMSLVGATTEEYVDDRTIPVPVGHETQYMGQSEDVVEIPSGSLSDGKRKFVAETSGGKTQYYWESDEYNDGGDSVDLISYNSSNNKYVFLNDGYLRIDTTDSLVAGFIRVVLQGANDRTICNEYLYLSNAGERHALFVRKGMKCYYTAIPTGVNFKFVPLI